MRIHPPNSSGGLPSPNSLATALPLKFSGHDNNYKREMKKQFWKNYGNRMSFRWKDY